MVTIDQALAYFFVAGIFYEWHPAVFRVMQWFQGGVSPLAMVEDFTTKEVAEQKENEKAQTVSRDSFVKKLLKLQRENPETVTDYDVFLACRDNVTGGSDTTSIALNSIICHVSQDINVLAKLRAEVDAGRASGSISRPITFSESQKLPYLQAVIKEALRMHPSTGFQLERLVPAEGATMSGYHFPAEVRLHRSPVRAQVY